MKIMKTDEKIDELNLIKNFSVIYSRDKNPKIVENELKQSIFKKIIKISSGKKLKIIQNFYQKIFKGEHCKITPGVL